MARSRGRDKIEAMKTALAIIGIAALVCGCHTRNDQGGADYRSSDTSSLSNTNSRGGAGMNKPGSDTRDAVTGGTTNPSPTPAPQSNP